jgi:hypothetical protein
VTAAPPSMPALAALVLGVATEQEEAGFLVALALEIMAQVGRGIIGQRLGQTIQFFENGQDIGFGLGGAGKNGGALEFEERVENGSLV